MLKRAHIAVMGTFLVASTVVYAGAFEDAMALHRAQQAQMAADTARTKRLWHQPPKGESLAQVRREYWDAYRSGKVMPELATTFHEHLAAKDFAHIALRLTTEKGTAQRTVAEKMMFGDYAINPGARPAFERWMEAVEDRLRQKLRNSGPGFNVKTAIEESLAETADLEQTYLLERNWSEFDLAGIELPVEQYVWMLVTRFPKPKSEAEATKLLEGLLKTFGEDNLRAVAERLRKAPLDNKGRIANSEAFGITNTRAKLDERGRMHPENLDPCPPGIEAINGAGMPWRAFRYGLFNTLPRGFALRVILDEVAFDSVDTDLANRVINRLEIAYGKPAVDAAIEKLRQAPKAMGGGLVDASAFNGSRYRSLFGSMKHELTRDPKGYARWLIASQEQIDDKAKLDAAYAELVKQHGEEKIVAAIQLLVEINKTPPEQRPAELAGYSGGDDQAYTQFKKSVTADKVPTAVADGLVVPRDYAEWSRWDIGAKVTVTSSGGQSLRGGPMKPHREYYSTYELKDIQPDHVVLYETGTSRRGAGAGDDIKVMARKRDDHPQYRGEPLQGQTGIIALPSLMGVTPVEETLTIAGKPVRCQKYMKRWREIMSDEEGTRIKVEETELVVHFSDDVPGTFVRSRRTTTSYTTSQFKSFERNTRVSEEAVTSFAAPGKPDPAPKRAFILPADAGEPLPNLSGWRGPSATVDLPPNAEFPPKQMAWAEAQAQLQHAPKLEQAPKAAGGTRSNSKEDPKADSPAPPSARTPEPANATGQPAVPAAKFCTSCGASLTAGAKFCTGCGAKIGLPSSK